MAFRSVGWRNPWRSTGRQIGSNWERLEAGVNGGWRRRFPPLPVRGRGLGQLGAVLGLLEIRICRSLSSVRPGVLAMRSRGGNTSRRHLFCARAGRALPHAVDHVTPPDKSPRRMRSQIYHSWSADSLAASHHSRFSRLRMLSPFSRAFRSDPRDTKGRLIGTVFWIVNFKESRECPVIFCQ